MQRLADFVPESLKGIARWSEMPLSPIRFAQCRHTPLNEPAWWIGSMRLAKTPVGQIKSTKPLASAGTSIYKQEALTRALGEGAERYSSLNSHLMENWQYQSFHNEHDFVRAGLEEPCRPSFKATQIATPIEHCQVEHLATGQQAWMPAEFVHLGFRRQASLMLTPPISTGCAFFSNQETALWKSICEVVERDAMMRCWHLQRPAIEIELSQIKDFNLKSRIKRLHEAGLELHLFEISQQVPLPTVFAVLKGLTYPYACVGASTDASLEKACIKAIDETMSIRMLAVWSGAKEVDTDNYSWINHLELHMELYANWKDTPAFDFLFEGARMSLEELKQHRPWLSEPTTRLELEARVDFMESLGYAVYAKDITLPELRPYGWVTRVIIPRMLPLAQEYHCRWLGDFHNQRINPHPHPFA